MVIACDIQNEWKLDPVLAERVSRVLNEFEHATNRSVRITSGFRTFAQQDALRRSGRPTAPNNVSNHTICPARAVDISLGFAPTRALKHWLGNMATKHGLRWGGGSPLDEDYIPSDWQHLDLGARV